MIETPISRALERFLDLNAFRHQLITSNLANVDTPGFFTPAVRQVEGLIQRPDGNNVNLEREGLLLAETQLRFNAGVQLLRKEFARILLAIREGSTS
jgi:flagellar basal-body rod protein FlgB